MADQVDIQFTSPSRHLDLLYQRYLRFLPVTWQNSLQSLPSCTAQESGCFSMTGTNDKWYLMKNTNASEYKTGTWTKTRKTALNTLCSSLLAVTMQFSLSEHRNNSHFFLVFIFLGSILRMNILVSSKPANASLRPTIQVYYVFCRRSSHDFRISRSESASLICDLVEWLLRRCKLKVTSPLHVFLLACSVHSFRNSDFESTPVVLSVA